MHRRRDLSPGREEVAQNDPLGYTRFASNMKALITSFLQDRQKYVISTSEVNKLFLLVIFNRAIIGSATNSNPNASSMPAATRGSIILEEQLRHSKEEIRALKYEISDIYVMNQKHDPLIIYETS